jgi:hypothetical protein
MAKTQAKQLVVCVDNDGYPASLDKRKIYVALRDADAAKHGLLRIVDESGDDYLYPKAFFRSIALPPSRQKGHTGRGLAAASLRCLTSPRSPSP